MSYMKDWDSDLLLLLSEQSNNDKMKSYIKSILNEKYLQEKNVSALYRKMRKNANMRNDILWNSISRIIASGNYLVLQSELDEILNNMPMEYLAIISTSGTDEVMRTRAREICYAKQIEYEKEIGIYDRGAELKFGLQLLK